jgi:hypothetical protein
MNRLSNGAAEAPARVHLAELAASIRDLYGYEDAIAGALQFFGVEDWRAIGQAARTVTLRSPPRVPWYLLLTPGFRAFAIPELALYHLHIRTT